MSTSQIAAMAANMVMNDLKNSGGYGHADNHTAILSPFVKGDADIIAFGHHFWRQSPKTFTKAEIEAGRIKVGLWLDGREYWDEGPFANASLNLSNAQVLFNNEVGYAISTAMNLNYTADGFVILVVYQTGTHSFTVQGNTAAVNIPYTGIYIGFPADVVPELPEKDKLSGGDAVEMFRCEWEHVSTISDKYLPGPVVIDFDVFGLTAPILELVNAGGGKLVAANTEISVDVMADVDAICNAFPLDGNYTVKLTVSNTDIWYVNPVFTSFDADGFSKVHFDAYIYDSDNLIKFYVICASGIVTLPAGQTLPALYITVGFHE